MLQPLAERLRPQNLDEYIGQEHLVGKGAILRRMIDAGQISSFILWGPPGVGKTTLAKIISNQLDVPFYTLSAIHSGVKDVRDVIEKCKKIVKQYAMEHLDKSDNVPEFDVFDVWYCKTLQNHKALLSTTLFDGMYYELTYNGDKKELYFDAYKKFENKCIKLD